MARHASDEIRQVVDLRQETAHEADSVSFMAYPFVQVTLPHSNPGDDVKEFARTNGKMKLVVQGAPDLGLPYGVIPRLILSWLTTEVTRKNERVVTLGRSLKNFMLVLGIDEQRGGERGNINPVKEQTARLFGSRVAAVWNSERGYRMQPIQLGDRIAVDWWSENEQDELDLFEDENFVELNEDFYHMLRERPVPVDERALSYLKDSALALDLYMWLTWRVTRVSSEEAIAWSQLEQQFGADYSETKEFARYARQQLKRIAAIWPDLNYRTPRGRIVLLPSKPHVPYRKELFLTS